MKNFERTQDDIAHDVRSYIDSLTNETAHQACVYLVHFPDLKIHQLMTLLGLGERQVQQVLADFRNATNWNRYDGENDFTLELRKNWPVDRKAIMNVLPDAYWISGYRYVIRKKKNTTTIQQRLNSIGWNILKRRYPKFCRQGRTQSTRQPLLWCCTMMHHQELELWIRHLADDNNEAYPIGLHDYAEPFTPHMMYPGIHPEINSILTSNSKYHRNFTLFAKLNQIDHEAQFRLMFPPKRIGKYTKFRSPKNQFELAGFHAHQLGDRKYLAKKTSPSAVDRRSLLLNCINIIQSVFPENEAGAQHVRRLLGNYRETIERGDMGEIQFWTNALIEATSTPHVTLEDLDYAAYKKTFIGGRPNGGTESEGVQESSDSGNQGADGQGPGDGGGDPACGEKAGDDSRPSPGQGNGEDNSSRPESDTKTQANPEGAENEEIPRQVKRRGRPPKKKKGLGAQADETAQRSSQQVRKYMQGD